MNVDTLPEYPTSEQWQAYAMFRSRIVEEDTLINNRLSWLIWLQASLFTAWGVIASGHILRGVNNIALLGALSVFGFIMSILVFASIIGARIEIRNCKKKYEANFMDLYNSKKIPRITGNRNSHFIGHVVPVLAPILYMCAQSILFYADWQLYLAEPTDAKPAASVPTIQLPVVTAPANQDAHKQKAIPPSPQSR